jgi:hypothetical protein
MNDHEANSRSPQGLELFFAMYAVGLGLGIQQTSEALYKSTQMQWTYPTPHFAWDVGLFIAILLLIGRFFWSTGNIRRALVRGRSATDAHYLIFHLPALLMQGVLVLFVCFSFCDYLAAKTSAFCVMGWFLVATLWNTIWLKFLVGETWMMPETFWIQNNFVFALLTGGLLAGSYWTYASGDILFGAFVFASIVSSLLDLGLTANFYLSESGH